MQILPYSSEYERAAEVLCDRAFGPDRRRRTAARLREGVRPLASTSFVAIDGGRLVGAVRCYPIHFVCAGGRRDLLLLGPLVAARKGEGIGLALMDHAIAAIDAAGLDVALIGDAPYYQRWGFSADATGQWLLPGPVERDRLLLRRFATADWDVPGHLTATPAAAAAAYAA
jgi:predicted N-acetyltransferase YhbS